MLVISDDTVRDEYPTQFVTAMMIDCKTDQSRNKKIFILLVISSIVIIGIFFGLHNISLDSEHIDGYPSYRILIEELHGVEQRLLSTKQNVSVESIGTSLEGESIKVISLAANEFETKVFCNNTNSTLHHQRPLVWVTCGSHAREWASILSCLHIIKEIGKTQSYIS